MAEWGDVVWERATPEYRTKQFVLLCQELVNNGEQDDACIELATTKVVTAEAMYDALDESITAAENAANESSEDDDEE